jgi:hypothetical protein
LQVLVERVEGDGVDGFGRVREVGVDLNYVGIAHDQQRWILQRLTILQKLLVGRFEICLRSLIFPAEATPPPDVGKPLPALHLACTFFETVPLPGGVRLGGSLLIEHPAQVKEMLLRRRAFLQLYSGPFLFELSYGHAFPRSWICHNGFVIQPWGPYQFDPQNRNIG